MAGKVYQVAIKLAAALSPKFKGETATAAARIAKLTEESKKLTKARDGAAALLDLQRRAKEAAEKAQAAAGANKALNREAAKLATQAAKLSAALEKAGVETADLAGEQAKLDAALARTTRHVKALSDAEEARARVFGKRKPDAPLLQSLGDRAGKVATRFRSVARDAAVMGGAVAGAVAIPLIKYREFEKASAEALTQAEAGTTLADLQGKARALSVAFGQDHVEQARALGGVISAGFGKLSEATVVMTQANKLAIAGTTDLDTSVDGLTTVVNAYGLGAKGAARASDVMVATMRLAKTTVPELASFIYEAAPTAAALGVKLEDLGAATAALTLQGTPTRVAMSRIRAAMDGLVKPSDDMVAIWRKHGYANGTAAIKALGLGGALAVVRKEAKGDVGQVTKLLGSVEAAQTAMVLGGTGAKSYADAIKELDGATGATDEAMGKMTSTFDHQAKMVKARATDIAISIGSRLAPIAVNALSRIAKWVDENRGAIEAWAVSASVWIETKLIPGVRNFGREMWPVIERLGEMIAKIADMVGGWGNFALIVAGIRLAPLVKSVADLAGSFGKLTLALIDYIRKALAAKAVTDGIGGGAGGAGGGIVTGLGLRTGVGALAGGGALGLAKLAGGVAVAGAAGYGIGTALDEWIGISDWIGGFGNRDLERERAGSIEDLQRETAARLAAQQIEQNLNLNVTIPGGSADDIARAKAALDDPEVMAKFKAMLDKQAAEQRRLAYQ